MKGKEHAEKNQNLIYQNRHQKIRIEQLKKNYSTKKEEIRMLNNTIEAWR